VFVHPNRVNIFRASTSKPVSRNPIALELLPRLLPAPDPKAQEVAIAETKFHHLKEKIRKLPDAKK
jgi:hypothetical protein